MFSRSTNWFVILASLTLTGFIGFKAYLYFTHAQPPHLSIVGIENQGTYHEIVECSLVGNEPYKIKSADITIDGKQVATPFNGKINARKFEKKFFIDTLNLDDGEHLLSIVVTDASYNRNQTHYKLTFAVDNQPLTATFNLNEYVVDQGKTCKVVIHANKKLKKVAVKALGKVFYGCERSATTTDYECFIPIDIEQTAEQSLLTAEAEDLAGNKIVLNASLSVKTFNFVKQKGFTIAHDKLEEERQGSLEQAQLEPLLAQAAHNSPLKKLWTGRFELPIDVKRTLTPHGEIRMTAERGRYYHRGVDLTDLPRSIIWASQHGIVVVKDRFFITGNTVVIDHGMGVFTLYAHLEDFADISVGSTVKKGNPIGRIGKTGYATGYHLHWEVIINGISVDPLDWIKISY